MFADDIVIYSGSRKQVEGNGGRQQNVQGGGAEGELQQDTMCEWMKRNGVVADGRDAELLWKYAGSTVNREGSGMYLQEYVEEGNERWHEFNFHIYLNSLNIFAVLENVLKKLLSGQIIVPLPFFLPAKSL